MPWAEGMPRACPGTSDMIRKECMLVGRSGGRPQAAEMGAGELAMPLRGVGPGVQPSPPLGTLSLRALLSSFILESALDPVESLLTSSRKVAVRGGAW